MFFSISMLELGIIIIFLAYLLKQFLNKTSVDPKALIDELEA